MGARILVAALRKTFIEVRRARGQGGRLRATLDSRGKAVKEPHGVTAVVGQPPSA
jgi:hypothetical protein